MIEIYEAVATAELAGDILKLLRAPQFRIEALYGYISERRGDEVARALLFLIDEAAVALEREVEALHRLRRLGERYGERYDRTVHELTELAADAGDTEMLEIEDLLLQNQFALTKKETAVAEKLLCGLGY